MASRGSSVSSVIPTVPTFPSFPPDLAAALEKNRKARDTFEGFSPSHKREYIEWIEGAKRDETRIRRLSTAVAQMAEGIRAAVTCENARPRR